MSSWGLGLRELPVHSTREKRLERGSDLTWSKAWLLPIVNSVCMPHKFACDPGVPLMPDHLGCHLAWWTSWAIEVCFSHVIRYLSEEWLSQRWFSSSTMTGWSFSLWSSWLALLMVTRWLPKLSSYSFSQNHIQRYEERMEDGELVLTWYSYLWGREYFTKSLQLIFPHWPGLGYIPISRPITGKRKWNFYNWFGASPGAANYSVRAQSGLFMALQKRMTFTQNTDYLFL